MLNDSDERPLPLIVAEKWGFPLAYSQVDNEVYFAIQDWVRGLTGEADVRKVLSKMLKQMSVSSRQLPYISTDGKTYQMDFTNDKRLYLIAQYLRATKKRLVLDEIKRFLAESGAFVDLVRRDPETVVTSGAMNADEAMDAAINAYRAQGKDDRWIRARLEGKIKREKFTLALQEAVAETLTRIHYALATDEIYKGLWNRTAAMLKDEMSISPTASLRDNQPALALTYQGIAEEVSAQKLGERTELSWNEAREIVSIVAQLIGKQAQATSRFLQTDLATGKPLLPRSRD